MTTWIALLRGINVGGKKSVPMAELRGLAESLDLQDVATYVRSGNLVFDSDEAATALVSRLEEAIADRFGFTVSVLIRDSASFHSIAESHPFERDENDPRFLVVAFLDREPAVKISEAIPAADYEPDRASLQGTELYIHYPNGSGRSKLTLDVIERRAGVRGTARNWRTVQRLAEMSNR